MPAKEVTLNLHRGLSPCRREFRVGFGIRAGILSRVPNRFKRSATLEAARNDRLGAGNVFGHGFSVSDATFLYI